MRRRWLTAGAALGLFLTAASLALLVVAMHEYPGGTLFDRHAAGHSFWLNFLCDLTNATAVNGAPNPGWIARAALTVLAGGLAAFWLVSPSLFAEQRKTGLVVRISGVVAAVGLAIVPLATGMTHAVAIYAAAAPGFVAAIAALVATLRHGRDPWLMGAACVAIGAGLVDAILYAQRVADHFQSCSPALPVFQRVSFLFTLVWMATAFRRVLRR